MHCVSASCFTDYGHYSVIVATRLVAPNTTINVIMYNSGMIIGCTIVNIEDQTQGTICNVY